jgi:pimeloyl-ACP methyl ester carboxylesterase
VAARIDPANRESWTEEWARMAAEVEAIAAAAPSTRTARDAYLRAVTYWRQAGFVVPFDDPRKLEYHLNHQRCFRTAMRWFETPVEAVKIPYEDSWLDGYLVRPAGGPPGPWPVVVFGGTFDSTAEEKYFAVGKLLSERGLAVLLLDGPGTGLALVQGRTRTRYDYEVPTAATIDWVETRPELDPGRVALVGWGSGGYYTCRAAAFEPRLAAGVAWNLEYNDPDPDDTEEPFDDTNTWRAEADSGRLGNPVFQRFLYELFMQRCNGDLEYLWKEERAATLKGILGRVTCPMLVLVGGEDVRPFEGSSDAAVSYAERVIAELGSQDKTLVHFAGDGPGSYHVQVDAQERARAIIADWLVERFLPERFAAERPRVSVAV